MDGAVAGLSGAAGVSAAEAPQLCGHLEVGVVGGAAVAVASDDAAVVLRVSFVKQHLDEIFEC